MVAERLCHLCSTLKTARFSLVVGRKKSALLIGRARREERGREGERRGEKEKKLHWSCYFSPDERDERTHSDARSFAPLRLFLIIDANIRVDLSEQKKLASRPNTNEKRKRL